MSCIQLFCKHSYTTAGNPKDILRTHSSKLTDAITTNVYRVTDALYAEGLIPLDTKEQVDAVGTGLNDYRKSSQVVSVLRGQLGASLNPEQYLIDICHVLINQQITDIAKSILHQLGECACVCTLGQSIPDCHSQVDVSKTEGIHNIMHGAFQSIQCHFC